MDSLTQAALGATVAGAIAGKRANLRTLLVGAGLGTLPDLDVFIDYGDPVRNYVLHRGFSHSLLTHLAIAPIFAVLSKRLAPSWTWRQRFELILAVLWSHALLDAMTTFGTDLFWPLNIPNVAVGNIFIIDPLYTLPLLLGLYLSIKRRHKIARYCRTSIAVSGVYLCWTLVAFTIVNWRVDAIANEHGLQHAQKFISPAPFNTLYWRVMLTTPSEYYDGFMPLFGKAQLATAKSRGAIPVTLSDNASHQALIDFSRDRLKYTQENGKFRVTDLRVGTVNHYAFSFYLAQQHDTDGSWQWLDTPIRAPRPALW